MLLFLKQNAATFSSKMYGITRSFVVDRYGTINEDSRELYKNCMKNDKNFEFFGYFKINFKHFWFRNWSYLLSKAYRDNIFFID